MSKKIRHHFCLMLIIIIQSAILINLASKYSCTTDESAHLVAGLSIIDSQKFNIYPVNPPLVKTIAAIPSYIMGKRVPLEHYTSDPFARPEFMMGQDFIKNNCAEFRTILFWSRASCIPLTLLGTIAIYLFANLLFNSVSCGLFAATLWAIDPLTAANGCLITTDVPSATMAILVAHAYLKYYKNKSTIGAVYLGGVSGLACLTKFSLIIFPLVIFGVLLVSAIYKTSMNCIPFLNGIKALNHIEGTNQLYLPLGRLILGIVMCLYVINVGYLFESSFKLLKDYKFVSRTMRGPNINTAGNRFEDSILQYLLVPFPENFIRGIDLQWRDQEKTRPTYFRGQWSQTGNPMYYVYALMVKTPHGIQILFFCVLLATLLHNDNRVPILIVVSIGGVFIAFISINSSFTHHFRYVLPGYAFFLVACSSLIASHKEFNKSIGRVVFCILMVLLVSASLLFSKGTSIGYFNELAGGAENGFMHFGHSALYWGEGYDDISNWIEEYSVEQARLITISKEADNCNVERACKLKSLTDTNRKFMIILDVPNFLLACRLGFLNIEDGAKYERPTPFIFVIPP